MRKVNATLRQGDGCVEEKLLRMARRARHSNSQREAGGRGVEENLLSLLRMAHRARHSNSRRKIRFPIIYPVYSSLIMILLTLKSVPMGRAMGESRHG